MVLPIIILPVVLGLPVRKEPFAEVWARLGYDAKVTYVQSVSVISTVRAVGVPATGGVRQKPQLLSGKSLSKRPTLSEPIEGMHTVRPNVRATGYRSRGFAVVSRRKV